MLTVLITEGMGLCTLIIQDEFTTNQHSLATSGPSRESTIGSPLSLHRLLYLETTDKRERLQDEMIIGNV